MHAPTLPLRTASAAVVFTATLATTDGAFTCEAIASGPGAGFSLVSMNDAACTTRITSLNSLTAACNPSVTPAPLGCTDSSFTGGSLKHLSEVGVFDSSCVAISRLIHTMDEFDGGVSFNVQVSTRVTRHDRFHIYSYSYSRRIARRPATEGGPFRWISNHLNHASLCSDCLSETLNPFHFVELSDCFFCFVCFAVPVWNIRCEHSAVRGVRRCARPRH
jgi:hypothetical protein